MIADPEVYVDTKTAVGMINVQFGAITSPTEMGAMRISGIGPSFVKLGQYVRYKVSTLQSFYRAMLVEYSSTPQCKLMQEERANDGSRHPLLLMSSPQQPMDEADQPVNWSAIAQQAFREVVLNLAV